MKKNILILILFSVLFLPSIAQAEGQSREISIYLYRDYRDCVFLIGWDNSGQTADIQITGPDGVVIDADGRNAVFEKGRVSVSVGDAQSGYWTVTVKGEDLGVISVSGGSGRYAGRENAIRSFNAAVEDGYLTFSWDVAAEQDTVTVSIRSDQGNSGSRIIWDSYSAEKIGSARVPADQFQTGLYRFTLQVYDGSAWHSLSTEEPVYMIQPKAPEKVTNIRIGSIDGERYAVWDAVMNSSYYVTLYDYETLQVIKSERIDSNFYPIKIDEETDKFKLSVQVTDGVLFGEFDIFEHICSLPYGTVMFPEFAATRSNSVSVTIVCTPGESAGLYLDGTLLLEDVGSGDYVLDLAEGIHEITGFIRDENGNSKTFQKSINVDKTPPQITLYHDDSMKTAEADIVITGRTEPDAVVSVNGAEQELGSGGFAVKIALEKGVNPITIAAYDAVGNKSVATIVVERTGSFRNGFGRYLISGAVFLMLTVWYACLNKKAKEAKPDEKAD